MSFDVLFDRTPLAILSSRFRGIGSYVRNLLAALQQLRDAERRGLAIGVLAGFDGPDAVVPLGSAALPAPDAPAMSERRWAWQRRTALVRLLWRQRPGLVHLTEPLGTPRGSPAPRIMTCYDLLELVMHQQYLPSPLRRALAWSAAYARFASARRVLSISQATADDLMRIVGVPASRIDVVPLAADASRFRLPADGAEAARASESRARLGLGRAPYLVYVGAPDPRKNIDTLCSAFARAAVPELELVLVGRYGAGEQRFVDRCLDAVGRPAAIRLLGFVPDAEIPAVYQGASALCFATSYEGFGLPVLEAMLCGCPVIASRHTSLAEIAGDAALYVPPRDEPALCDAIRRIAREPTLGAELRAGGLAQAARFSWRSTALGTVESYARALSGR